MTDENKDCVTKSKLTTTVKTLSKYNNRSRVAASEKQSQRHRNVQIFRHKGLKEQKDILTNRRTSSLRR